MGFFSPAKKFLTFTKLKKKKKKEKKRERNCLGFQLQAVFFSPENFCHFLHPKKEKRKKREFFLLKIRLNLLNC
jgi:hypothetical protein